MTSSIRAIYSNGQLNLLDPVEFEEQELIELIFVGRATDTLEAQTDVFDLVDDEAHFIPEPEALSLAEIDQRLAQRGLLTKVDIPNDAQELTPAERERIGKLFKTSTPVEVDIDADRGLY